MYTPKTYRPWTFAITCLLVVGFVWLLLALKPILTPFVMAAVLAYILNPLTTKLTQYMSRSLASMTVMVMALLILAVLLLVIVPMLIEQIHSMVTKIPSFIHWLNFKAVPKLNAIFHTQYQLDTALLNQLWEENGTELQAMLKKSLPLMIKQSGGVIATVANLMILPFLLYYFLLDWNRWTETIQSLIPRRYLDFTQRILKELDEVLGEWLRGQLVVMLVMALIYGLGLAFLGLENGFAIGMVAGLLVFVPYLGAFTGLLLATLAAILQYGNWGGLIAVWAVFGVGQFLESFIITPRLVGERIGLSPLAVIFALMAFGQLMGFTGMLLALPLAAVCVVLFREGVQWYFASDYYQKR